MSNRFEISAASLSKSELKEVHKVLSTLGENATVAHVRSFCSPGPVMTVIYTLLTAGLLAGLSVLFLPLLFVSAVSLVVVPLKVAKTRGRWAMLLPAERDADVVALV